MKKPGKKPKRLGERIGDALAELAAAIRSGRPLHEQFAVHAVETFKTREEAKKPIQRSPQMKTVGNG